MGRERAISYAGMYRCDAAPLGSVRIQAAINVMCIGKGTKRSRRRGPRSALAESRRKYRRLGGAPADATSGESGTNASVDIDSISPQSFLIYCINIRCLLSNFAELCHQVKVLSPQVVLLQETWLNKSIEEVQLPNYRIESRRDRNEGANREAVATYAREDIYNMVCVKISIESERV